MCRALRPVRQRKKTTLLRHLKRELAPVGSTSGTLTYKGQPLSGLPAAVAAGEIGMVFQNPDAQIVMDTVWHELAFSMENLGLPPAVMRTRLAEICGLFGLEPLLYRPVHELSGGQKAAHEPGFSTAASAQGAAAG
ncbi:ATP-binding cassette domain-containing protein [Paenibacillus rhizoplanae]